MTASQTNQQETPDQLIQRIDELLTALQKPIFVYQMAKAMDHPEVYQTKAHMSAKTRRRNAAVQIDKIVETYVTGALT